MIYIMYTSLIFLERYCKGGCIVIYILYEKAQLGVFSKNTG